MGKHVWKRGALVLATVALVGLGSCVDRTGAPTDTAEELLDQLEKTIEGQIAVHRGGYKPWLDEAWIMIDGTRLEGDEPGLEDARSGDFEMELLRGERALEYSEGRTNNVILLTTKDLKR